jgi:RNA-directed DNA polymerase
MSPGTAKNPNGGAKAGRVTGTPAVHVNLLERILSPENMRIAWKRIKANRGAPGVDGITIDEFPDLARPHWEETRSTLLSGT